MYGNLKIQDFFKRKGKGVLSNEQEKRELPPEKKKVWVFHPDPFVKRGAFFSLGPVY